MKTTYMFMSISVKVVVSPMFLWGVSMLTNCGNMEDVGIVFNKMWSLGPP